MSAVAERVAAGAAFLDQYDPGWWRADAERAIDLSLLDLRNCQRCIIGQIAWDYDTGLRELGIRGWSQSDALGFTTEESYGTLTAEWTRVITARREAGQ